MGFPINLVNEAKFEEKVSLFVSRVNNFGQTGQRYRETSYLIEPGDVHKLDILAKTLRDLCLQGKGFVGTSGRKTLHQGKWRPAQEAIPLEPKTFKENGTYRDELTYGNYEFFPEMAQKNGHTIMAHSFQLGAHERIKHRLNISEANILKLQNLGVID
ncbi:MAG: hypothetical protein P1U91_03575 [Pseudophaeobacter sp. bin_em_oilr2.035]|nr:hypothetical protein [Phaeobacter gallaeciensis]MDF1771014.1 hypothetical protein [Pseudophaeobacter sp. bin_em_oilr2.035]MDE4144715.1 hypothetical protein [Phaeobacter gallaeciensis]MDE4161431.1 hypothetical protein [Phaeobacter gallaeciensis]MDE4169895.1 hypothetical protein [Phaeobacter gallaeciensis]MDE4178555.1 hypothetical protein [Phaeobacter gallaeciensis]